MRIALVTAALAAAIAAATAAARIASFRLPSKNIACSYATGFGAPFLRCDVLSGLRPRPRRRCEGDWVAVSMTRRSRAHPVCVSDTVYDTRAPFLRYGRTWRRGGFMCTARFTGLTCRNLAGHGFFLSRRRYRVW